MNRKELQKAFEEGLIDEEIYKEELFKLAQSPSKSRKAKRYYEPFTMEEFTKLMGVTKNEKHRLAFMLGMGSGLRISEIVGGKREDGSVIPPLTADNINLKTKKIMIRSAKGKKDRITNVPKWFREKHLKLLPIELTERALEKAFHRNSFKCGINKVIDHYERKDRNGEMQKVPVNQYKFHSLRSGWVSELLKRNVPITYVRDLAGHESLATTNKYAKAKKQDAIDRIMEAWDE